MSIVFLFNPDASPTTPAALMWSKEEWNNHAQSLFQSFTTIETDINKGEKIISSMAWRITTAMIEDLKRAEETESTKMIDHEDCLLILTELQKRSLDIKNLALTILNHDVTQA